jgi:hypothetical protein
LTGVDVEIDQPINVLVNTRTDAAPYVIEGN